MTLTHSLSHIIFLFNFFFAPLNHMLCHRQALCVLSLALVPKVANLCNIQKTNMVSNHYS